jgi:hypothetical protein
MEGSAKKARPLERHSLGRTGAPPLSMAFKARVYLQRFGHTHPEYLGEIDLDMRPIREGRIRFTHQGVVVAGHIDNVAPADWDKSGAIPAVYVVQR